MKKPILPTEIEINFHRSHFLWGWCLVFSIGVMACVWGCLPWPWAAWLTIGYAAACVWHYGQWVATTWRYSVQSLKVDVYGQMTLASRDGQVWSVNVLPDSVVHPWCIVLHLRYSTPHTMVLGQAVWCPWLRARYVLILPDHADRIALRALRVWLRWGLRY